tara:strand:- start:10 stop:231 length:222 start_codon:yes stop_codon:yes gene_type:complete
MLLARAKSPQYRNATKMTINTFDKFNQFSLNRAMDTKSSANLESECNNSLINFLIVIHFSFYTGSSIGKTPIQ